MGTINYSKCWIFKKGRTSVIFRFAIECVFSSPGNLVVVRQSNSITFPFPDSFFQSLQIEKTFQTPYYSPRIFTHSATKGVQSLRKDHLFNVLQFYRCCLARRCGSPYTFQSQWVCRTRHDRQGYAQLDFRPCYIASNQKCECHLQIINRFVSTSGLNSLEFQRFVSADFARPHISESHMQKHHRFND